MTRVRHAQNLLAWFDRHRRDLPWRRTRDPYRIWLSEVMLQQTRVEVVLPYYKRFLEKFATAQALAQADLEEVLALWSGLGYYRRARQLHAAARRVAELGGFPRTVEGLRELPGIGPYTAAAVASIAFGVPEPVLDGNVERVLSRWLALDADSKGSAARKALLAAASSLLDPERPGDSNQALMELGATLCTPRRPKCLLCPLSTGCRAAAGGNPERYPPPRVKREPERHRLLVAVVEDDRGVLLFRRPDDSELLAGTWELPWVPVPADGSLERAETDLGARYGGRWSLREQEAAVRHGITYRNLEIAVHRAELAERPKGGPVRHGSEAPEAAAGWFDEGRRAGLPQSSLVGKVLGSLAEGGTLRRASAGGPPARRSRSRRRG